MSKRMNLVSTLIILFFLFLGSSISLGNEVSLTLIYTSNTLGELESGCCPETGNAGGLARRSHYIKTVKQEVKNLIIVDGGDALVLDYFNRISEREKARKRAEFVLMVYERMGYDALNIGDTDLGLGVEYLRNLQKKSKIPFLSANLKDKKTGKTIFNPYLIKKIAGSRVGIIGLLTPEISPVILKELKGYVIEDPIKAATEMTRRLKTQCDHLIVLAHLTPSEIVSLAKGMPEISIIIGGQDRSFVFPKKINRSLVVQTDAFGIHIGRLNLRLVKGSSEYIDGAAKSKLQKNIEEIQKKIDDPQYIKDVKNLIELKETLSEQIKKLPETEGKNTYENYLTLMHPGMESDKEIEKLIDSSRDQLKRPIP
jgi:2',3'-cyclic-nucleotide 2'-phosphodiesterase (5'-nucleotidase family)